VLVAITTSKGMWAVKLRNQQNPPVLNWRCQITQVDLYNGRNMIVVVAVAQQYKKVLNAIQTIYIIKHIN